MPLGVLNVFGTSGTGWAFGGGGPVDFTTQGFVVVAVVSGLSGSAYCARAGSDR